MSGLKDQPADEKDIRELLVSFICEAPTCEREEWLHVVGTYNGSMAAIHINGKERASRSCSTLGLGAVCGEITYAAAAGEDTRTVKATPLVIGSYYSEHSGRHYTHVGAMKMARIYSSALSVNQVTEQFMEAVKPRAAWRGQPEGAAGLWNARVSSCIYWLSSQNVGIQQNGYNTSYNTPTPSAFFQRIIPLNLTQNDRGLPGGGNEHAEGKVSNVSSPDVSSADVQEKKPISLQGIFLTSIRYRCRFGFRHSLNDTTVVFTPAYVSQEGLFLQPPSLNTLAKNSDAAGTEYGTSLMCHSPEWHHGFRVVHLGVEYENTLASRDAGFAAGFDYLAGTRVEIDVGVLGLKDSSMPQGITGVGTLAKDATRLGYIKSHNYTTGYTIIDLPDDVALNIFKSVLEITLPDMRVYPIDDRLSSGMWKPVWQRQCIWQVCGFTEPWYRSQADSLLYASMHLFSGVPAKFVLKTQSFLLVHSNKGVGNDVYKLPGNVFAEVEWPVSSILSVQRGSASYLLVGCDSDGSSQLSPSALHVHSFLYRVQTFSSNMSEGEASKHQQQISMRILQQISTKGARQWLRGEVSTSSGIQHFVALASMQEVLKIYRWAHRSSASVSGNVSSGSNLSESEDEVLVEQYRLPQSEGASGAACLRMADETFVAVALYYNSSDWSYITGSKLFLLHHASGAVTGASQVQTFEVVGASGVEHMTMNGRHFLAFLTATPVSRSTRHTVVYEWIGKTVAAATASALPLFRPLQSLETPGGAWALKLMTFSAESHVLMVSMNAACHTQQSGLVGQCSAMLRWNGDKFAGPFNTQATSLRDTGLGRGQQLPGATSMHLFHSDPAAQSDEQNVIVLLNFEEKVVARSPFVELGTRRDVTRNTRAYLLLQRSEKLSCLGAPVAVVLDEHDEHVVVSDAALVPSRVSWSRLLVLSYHHSAITIFDRCSTTGVLTITPSVTQCFPALSNTAVSGQRGAVGMVLSNATQGCQGDERYTRCLYVLDLSARPAIVADAGHVSGGIHILGLQGHTGQLEFLSTLYSGSEAQAQAILPLSSSASRFVRGLGGARAMQISSDGLVMVLGSWEEQGVLLFDRDKTTGRLTYGDMMTEGERMTWLFNSVLPPPSPAALPFTLPPQYRSDTYLMRLDFGGQRDQEEPASMLSAASRVTGLGVGGTLWSQSFVDSDKTHLLVAAGDKGAILYTWNVSAQRFMTGKVLSSKDASSTDYTSGIDSYCVHVSLATPPSNISTSGSSAPTPRILAIVANADSGSAADIPRSEDYDADSRTRVFEWLPQVQGFVYSHSLPSYKSGFGESNTLAGMASRTRKELANYCRATAAFAVTAAAGISSGTYVAAAIHQDRYRVNLNSAYLVEASLIYLWHAATERFRIKQTVVIPGAFFVTHAQVPRSSVGGGGSHDVLIWASLYSFSGGCETIWETDLLQESTKCQGDKQARTNLTVMSYNIVQDRFVVRQVLECTGCSHVLAFRLPCADNVIDTNSTCVRHYLALSSRQQVAQIVPHESMPSSSAYLQQFDAQSSLWVWDEELIVESDRGGYVEVPPRSAFGGDGTIPSPVTADGCKDKDMDMQLPYGPCFTYMSGEFNEGFCEVDGVCDTCQASCALECQSTDAACNMTQATDFVMYGKRFAGLWDSLSEVQGLRGATSMLHFEHEDEHYLSVAQSVCDMEQTAAECRDQFLTQPQSAIFQVSFVCCACVCVCARERCFEG